MRLSARTRAVVSASSSGLVAFFARLADFVRNVNTGFNEVFNFHGVKVNRDHAAFVVLFAVLVTWTFCDGNVKFAIDDLKIFRTLVAM